MLQSLDTYRKRPDTHRGVVMFIGYLPMSNPFGSEHCRPSTMIECYNITNSMYEPVWECV